MRTLSEVRRDNKLKPFIEAKEKLRLLKKTGQLKRRKNGTIKIETPKTGDGLPESQAGQPSGETHSGLLQTGA